MPANVFCFDEHWDLPDATAMEVYDVLARGELLPQWWKGVYLDAKPLQPVGNPKIGDRIRARARGALPYELNFILESVDLVPGRRVQVRTVGDFDGLWTADISERGNDARVDLVWQVTVLRPVLKFLAPLLWPAFAWNHRWTTPRGERGLKDFLKASRAQPVTIR